MGTAPSPWSAWLENCTILHYSGLHSYPITAFNSLFYSSKLGCNGNRECLSIVTSGFPQEGTFPHCPSTPQPIFPALSHHKFHMLCYIRILLLLKLFPNIFWWLDACSQKHTDCNRRSCGSPWRNRNYNGIFLFLSCRINTFSIHIYSLWKCYPERKFLPHLQDSVSQRDKYFQSSIPLSFPWKIQDNEGHRAADGKVLVRAGDGKEGVPWKRNITLTTPGKFSTKTLEKDSAHKSCKGEGERKKEKGKRRKWKGKRAPFQDSQETWKKLERTRQERARQQGGASQRLPGLSYEVLKETLSFSVIPWEKEQWKGQVSPAVASLKDTKGKWELEQRAEKQEWSDPRTSWRVNKKTN